MPKTINDAQPPTRTGHNSHIKVCFDVAAWPLPGPDWLEVMGFLCVCVRERLKRLYGRMVLLCRTVQRSVSDFPQHSTELYKIGQLYVRLRR